MAQVFTERKYRIPALVYRRNTQTVKKRDVVGEFFAFCERRDILADHGEPIELAMRKGKLMKSSESVDWGPLQTVVSRRGLTAEKTKDFNDVSLERAMNPVPIVLKDGGIILVFSTYPTTYSERRMLSPELQGRKENHCHQVFMTKLDADGESWSTPTLIASFETKHTDEEYFMYAPGPGHGIQLSSGRLIIPGHIAKRVEDKGQCESGKDDSDSVRNGTDLLVKRETTDDANGSLGVDEPDSAGHLIFYHNSRETGARPQMHTISHGVLLYSDDNGRTWEVGTQFKINDDELNILVGECQAAEIDGGHVYINSRIRRLDTPKNGEKKRASDSILHHRYHWILNKIDTLGMQEDGWFERDLIDPICQGSIISFDAGKTKNRRQQDKDRWVVSSNVADCLKRQNLSVRLSRDGLKTWCIPLLVQAGPSAYSDLTCYETENGDIMFGCLYERGTNHETEEIAFKSFSLKQLVQNEDATSLFSSKDMN